MLFEQQVEFFSVLRCFSSNTSVFPSPQNLSFRREAKFHTQPARKQRSQNRDKTYEASYRKYFENTYGEIHKESTNDEVRQVYVIWAVEYDKEIRAAGAFFHKPLAECLDTTVNQVFLSLKKTELKILDAGAVTEHLGIELLKLGYTDTHILDISQVMLNIAQAKKGLPYRRFICCSDRKNNYNAYIVLNSKTGPLFFNSIDAKERHVLAFLKDNEFRDIQAL